MTVAGTADWQDKDHIIVTTTDYLPGQTEELIINGTPTVSNNVTTMNFNTDGVTTGVKWPHNGQTIDLTTATYPGIGRLGWRMASGE